MLPIRFSATGRSGATRNTAASSFSASASRLSRISVATCSKTSTTSRCCAKVVAANRHAIHKRKNVCALCAFLRLFDEFFLIDLALAFFDRDDPVHAHVRNLINRAAGPTHLNGINLRAFLESEVQTQIALRYVTVAAAHLIRLRQITGDDRHARPNAATITLYTDSLDHDRIVCVPGVVAQQLRRPVEIRNQEINVTIVINITEGDAAAHAILSQDSAKLR